MEGDVTKYVKSWQRRIGVKDDGNFGPKTLAASLAVYEQAQRDAMPETVPTGSSELQAIGSQSLGVRALDVCLAEARYWGNRQVDEQRRAEYLAGCERDGKELGHELARAELAKPGKQYAFCAAAQGWAEFGAAIPGIDAMPPWRAGALEMMRDAADRRRPGQKWLPLSAVTNGSLPRPGDIAVYSNTQRVGAGHVERVWQVVATGFKSVGANENDGRWVIDSNWVSFTAAGKSDGVQRLQLLGFISEGH